MDDLLELQQDIPAKDLQIYEICACFWGELYFSNMYIATRDKSDAALSLDKNSSLTNEYVKTVRCTIYAIKNDRKVYLGILDKMYEFYKACSFVYATNYTTFLQEFTKVFIPEEFFEKMYKPQKDKILCEIITKIADKTSVNVISPDFLSLIIDTHNPSSSTIIRNRFMNIIIRVRNEMYKMFILSGDKSNEEQQLNELRKKLLDKDKIITKIKDKYDDLKDDYEDLREEYKELKSKMKKYSKTAKVVGTSDVVESKNEDAKSVKSNKSGKSSKSSSSLSSNYLSSDDSKSSISSLSSSKSTRSKASITKVPGGIKPFNNSSVKAITSGLLKSRSTPNITQPPSSNLQQTNNQSVQQLPSTFARQQPTHIVQPPTQTTQTTLPNLSNNNLIINKTTTSSYDDFKTPINPYTRPVNTMFKNNDDVSVKNNIKSKSRFSMSDDDLMSEDSVLDF
jgi:hypothetical protein